jgi:hypothetical protein
MTALTAEQRDAILSRFGGFVVTYFSQEELDDARFSHSPQLSPAEVEFHDYLRLASVLLAGRKLPPILHRIGLAPSFSQDRVMINSRGRLDGRLDVKTYLKRRGDLTTPRTFPVWRTRALFTTPENALAASAARSLLAELQILTYRLPIGRSSQGVLARQITEAMELALLQPALGESLQFPLPELSSSEAEDLLAVVRHRWQTRRISNLAYRDLVEWAVGFRKRGLGKDGVLEGLAYSEGFDDRLFEIFCLGCIREALRAMGFVERIIRPLHERHRAPVFEVEHPDSGLHLSLYFQRGEGILWTSVAPKEWGISGTPDIVLSPSSSLHPAIVLDAKNRFRGESLEGGASEEIYKMLGYFENFQRTTKVNDRGPLGGLFFPSFKGSSEKLQYDSIGGGFLAAITIDPTAVGEDGCSGVVPLLSSLLEKAGLIGSGRRDMDAALKELKVADAAVTTEEAILDGIHNLIAATYGRSGRAMDDARRGLEQHLLGSAWSKLDDDVQTMLATGEVFWSQHSLAFGMDFAPVVVEFSRALEVILSRLLFDQFRRWASERSRPSSSGTLTLGQMRAAIEAASGITKGLRRAPEAQSLHEYFCVRAIDTYVYDELAEGIAIVNRLRRRAAHTDMITSNEAKLLRDRLLGVGTSEAILARLVETLTPLN